MPIQIEARRLSGVDRGKHIRGTSTLTGRSVDGALEGVSHSQSRLAYLFVEGQVGVPFNESDTVTITGRPS